MAQIIRSLRRFSNAGAIDNAALEVELARVDLLIIEALVGRLGSAGDPQDPHPRHQPSAA